jgi:hypothetical protein
MEKRFLEAKDDIDELASFMKANEMDGAKSVHFVFANSPPEGPQAVISGAECDSLIDF